MNCETLETRTLMSATGVSDLQPDHGPAETVYVESNNPQPGQNAVIALRRESFGWIAPPDRQISHRRHRSRKRDARTGAGRFRSGSNRQPRRPIPLCCQSGEQFDCRLPHSRQWRAAPHRNVRVGRRAACKSGPVARSPVRRQSRRCIQGKTASIAPNYTVFNVSNNGTLVPIPGSTVTLPVGLSPSQALISPRWPIRLWR